MVRSRRACAKINLTLEVIGKRDDGYHDIASVVQAIDLCDTLHFQPEEYVCLASSVPQLVSPRNIVYQAVELLRDIAGSRRGVSIDLEKGIPLASGLGGGSSDAAATLQAVNELWELNLQHEELIRLGASLGSDVPFFLGGEPTALVEGRGENVTSLPTVAKTCVVLVMPPVEIANKTQEMYARLDPSYFSRGEYTQRMVELIEEGGRIDPRFCYNAFDDAAFSFFTELEDYRIRFMAAGARRVHLAGSGPALFTLAEGKAQGEDIYHRLKKEKVEVHLTETL